MHASQLNVVLLTVECRCLFPNQDLLSILPSLLHFTTDSLNQVSCDLAPCAFVCKAFIRSQDEQLGVGSAVTPNLGQRKSSIIIIATFGRTLTRPT